MHFQFLKTLETELADSKSENKLRKEITFSNHLNLLNGKRKVGSCQTFMVIVKMITQ